MKFYLSSNEYFDTSRGFDISLPLTNSVLNPTAWYVDPPRFEPVRANGFVGSVQEGGSVNFRDVFFNPHGHGTHTECLGHITETVFSINQSLKEAFFSATLVSVEPQQFWNEAAQEMDLIITAAQLKKAYLPEMVEAFVLRTLPNSDEKCSFQYSASNPPYLDLDCIAYLESLGVKHLLLDLPSVDRENDGGKLAFHHAFWQVPENPQFDKTITELIYVPDFVLDGNYILNLQTAPFENDATPSRPVLFKIETTDN